MERLIKVRSVRRQRREIQLFPKVEGFLACDHFLYAIKGFHPWSLEDRHSTKGAGLKNVRIDMALNYGRS